MTLFNLNNMETETPSPKLATMEIMASTYKFDGWGRDINMQSITEKKKGREKENRQASSLVCSYFVGLDWGQES